MAQQLSGCRGYRVAQIIGMTAAIIPFPNTSATLTDAEIASIEILKAIYFVEGTDTFAFVYYLLDDIWW